MPPIAALASESLTCVVHLPATSAVSSAGRIDTDSRVEITSPWLLLPPVTTPVVLSPNQMSLPPYANGTV